MRIVRPQTLLAIATLMLPLVGMAGRAAAQTTHHDPDDGAEHAQPFRHYTGVDGWDGPRLTFTGDMGVGGFVEGSPVGFGAGTGAATSAGPAWGARIGVDVLPFLGFELRYLGMYNEGAGAARASGFVAMLTNSGSVVVRLIAPIRYVRPYAFGGLGLYDTRVVGGSTARQGSTLTDSFEWGVPMGVGVDLPISSRISVGMEGTYHLLMGESFSTSEAWAGGDPLTGTAFVRGHM